MRRALGIFVLLAVGCVAKREPLGGTCEETYQCKDGLVCDQSVCSERKPVGASCDNSLSDYNRHCQFGLRCSPQGICETEEMRVSREAKEVQAQEQELLRQSGVAAEAAAEPVAEVPVLAPAAGLAVRVVRTKGKGFAFAVCGDTERLTGGGCNTTMPVSRSFPSHFSESDSVGGRWNCELHPEAKIDVEAYALCQVVE